ncbi:hypothetical protein NC651_032800 [Populus alba x Populus x berolinensis]|nr:hypothetical protein NC651_032800 [Populus alba x Populus x berolinensis]
MLSTNHWLGRVLIMRFPYSLKSQAVVHRRLPRRGPLCLKYTSF